MVDFHRPGHICRYTYKCIQKATCFCKLTLPYRMYSSLNTISRIIQRYTIKYYLTDKYVYFVFTSISFLHKVIAPKHGLVQFQTRKKHMHMYIYCISSINTTFLITTSVRYYFNTNNNDVVVIFISSTPSNSIVCHFVSMVITANYCVIMIISLIIFQLQQASREEI